MRVQVRLLLKIAGLWGFTPTVKLIKNKKMMFYFYNNTNNLATGDMKKLIKVLEKGRTRQI